MAMDVHSFGETRGRHSGVDALGKAALAVGNNTFERQRSAAVAKQLHGSGPIEWSNER